MTKVRRPACIETAAAILQESGEAAVLSYYYEVMTPHERTKIDRWLLAINHAILRKPGPQQWRFMQIVMEFCKNGK